MKVEKTYRFIQAFYFFSFFGFGALFPLLSVFLEEEKGLSHTQIGMVIAALPIITIFIQPLWGMLSDYTRRPRILLMVAASSASLLGLFYPALQLFPVLLAGIAIIAIFQAGIVPLSDSLSLSFSQSHRKQYGNIRLWGAVGFAIAVFIVGRVTEETGSLSWIFYFFSIGLLFSLITLFQFPKRADEVTVSFRTGLTTLLQQKPFLLFLVSNFLVFGPILANNYYFGTFILTVGGTLSGVGLAFLLAAGSEAPFMKISQLIIDRLGVITVVITGSAVSAGRWLLYYFDPSTTVVYLTTIAQGLSVGLYIPAALILVRELAPKEVRATAVGLYSAVGNGIGNAFFTFMGGFLIDVWNVNGMYGFFSIMSMIGIVLVLVVQRWTKPEVKELIS
ncbi:putative transporter YwbF [Halobacillus andaensis]|uniref:Transporter YwbF n=1 Tax=Halobacillus andaensis TaxID=1176239 RepID=A0A917AY30_HALAA|nr:MFS transporter [Halobacillus andaensis]MBP2002794.1 PPP family 3-phenylpropionic acid transporter [Halobacillus andaensis]GGF05761.1 putative transporter YwbF [Halobacillus andaensis]